MDETKFGLFLKRCALHGNVCRAAREAAADWPNAPQMFRVYAQRNVRFGAALRFALHIGRDERLES